MIEIKVPIIPGKKDNILGKIEVKKGDLVEKGQVLASVETAKGNREIKASQKGQVEDILADEGDKVSSSQTLFILKEENKKEEEEKVDSKQKDTKLKKDLLEIKVPVLPGKKDHRLGKIEVEVGDDIKEGQTLCSLETAKGVREVKSGQDGKVKEILAKEGDQVRVSQTLMILEVQVEEKLDKNFDQKPLAENQNSQKDLIETDLLVIGAGPGGYVGAIYGAKRGLDVTLVEKDSLGGTCLNVGCIPTKTLVESANRMEMLKDMEDFGIEVDDKVSVDMDQVIDRKDSIVSNLVSGVDHLVNKNKIRLIKGQASFISDKEVQVGSNIIKAKNIIIATGSVENKLKVKGYDLEGVIGSTEALELRDVPKSLVLIGGGVIGLEFASIYKSFGSKVHIVEYMDRLLPMFDKDLGKEMEEVLKEKEIMVSTSAKVVSIEESVEKKYIVTYEKDGKTFQTIGDKVLMATGRRANTSGLGLDKTSIKVDEKTGSILVDKYRKTNVEGVFAIGDVSSRLKLAHLASHEAILAVDYIMGEKRDLYDIHIPSVVYTKPEIASIGYMEEDLKAKNIEYKKSVFDLVGNGKAMTMGQNRGFIKLLASKDGKILGGQILGPDASNLIGSLSIAMKNDLKIEDLSGTVFPHPSTSEIIHEAAMDLLDRGLHI